MSKINPLIKKHREAVSDKLKTIPKVFQSHQITKKGDPSAKPNIRKLKELKRITKF
jgi:hypothetical protein